MAGTDSKAGRDQCWTDKVAENLDNLTIAQHVEYHYGLDQSASSFRRWRKAWESRNVRELDTNLCQLGPKWH